MVQRAIVLKELGAFSKILKSELGAEKIILFGSYAKKNPGKDSDIDIIIVSGYFKSMPFFERSFELRKKFRLKIPMDIICLTPEEFKERKDKITIVREAVENGIEIK